MVDAASSIIDHNHIEGVSRPGPQRRHTVLTQPSGSGDGNLTLLQSIEHSSQNNLRVGTYSIRDREVAEQSHAVSTTTLLSAGSRGTGAVTLCLREGQRGVAESVAASTVTAELNGEVLVRTVGVSSRRGRAEVAALLLREIDYKRVCGAVKETSSSRVNILDTSDIVTADRGGGSAGQGVVT